MPTTFNTQKQYAHFPRHLRIFAIALLTCVTAMSAQSEPMSANPEPLSASANETSAVTTKVNAAHSSITIPSLPEGTSNNAVATLNIDDTVYLFSFMGLSNGKTHNDVHNNAWQLKIINGDVSQWQALPDVPSSLPLKGRLASVAVGVNDAVYIFGGYTVAEDHTEISTPDVYKYSPAEKKYTLLPPMPIPVDDAVALVYQSRYVYLISGWHNDGNVNLVQVFDTQTNTWHQASPFLGKPVFGHAGGLVQNTMLVCDGVAVLPNEDKRRSFRAETACYKGVIDTANHLKIDWRIVQHPTGTARYRMASAGDTESNRILFVGGSNNPYNYNGIGYNGKPSEPSADIWVYNIATGKWTITTSPTPTMDHRGLIQIDGRWVTIGGMSRRQKVLSKIIEHL